MFATFAHAQYKQNVGGRVISKAEYITKGVASESEIDSLLSLTTDYPLTKELLDEYKQNGFVVLKDFLNTTFSSALEKVIGHNLDELAFPDMLTGCSRKFHGEYYHISITWRFWQQPRIANMISKLALGGDTPYSVTSEILEIQNGPSCIPQWHWDFLTFPQTYEASYTSGAQIWMSSEYVDETIGGGITFVPGSHLWAHEGVDMGSSKHPCFIHNLFEPLSEECQNLLETTKVAPTLAPTDIVVFSRFTLHRSLARDPERPFESGRRLGYTLRLGSGSSIFKRDTMCCFPSHPTSNFDGQIEEGERYDSAAENDNAVYRPMQGPVDSEESILKSGHGMSLSRFLTYSIESTFRQKVHYKLFSAVEQYVNGLAGSQVLDVSYKALPTADS
ncbi:expressed unknown protein [Seminavis robusta]|uniref:Phytanoyl-CoA dioxygenase family protein n=1 Tax=Seminavis robusta TaxID=568900 RepID=A0A9N8E168_9STRA|nr:expressed unknown protein [Seminavis robusta]|eukprot:Sro405_g136080.1 n/a (390) ;mRNA; r:20227-21396